MSLAHTPDRLQLPDGTWSISSMTSGAWYGRSRSSRPSRRRASAFWLRTWCCSGSTGCGTRRRWCAWCCFWSAAAGVRERSGLSAPLGLAEPAARSSSRGCWRGDIRGWATSCWGSSSWRTTNSSRRGRRSCARRRSGKSPAMPGRSNFRRRCRIPAIGSGWLVAGVPLAVAAVLLATVPGRGGERLAAVPGAVGRHAAVYVHRAREAAGPPGRGARRAVLTWT